MTLSDQIKKSKYCVIDFETRSKVDLTVVGAARYAADPSTEIISVSFRFLTDSFKKSKVFSFSPFTKDLKKAVEILSQFKGVIVSHNYFFELCIFLYTWREKRLKHFTDPANYMCTMALGHRYGLPGKLSLLADALELPNRKAVEIGKNLIGKFSKPDKDGNFREFSAADIKNFIFYGSQDVEVETDVFITLMEYDDWNNFEDRLFRLDQKINLRGLRFDIPLVKKLNAKYLDIVAETRKEAIKMLGVTDVKKQTPVVTSTKRFKCWLNENGVNAPDIQKPTLDDILEKTTDKKIRQAIEYRSILQAKAPGKLDRIIQSNIDGIIHGLLQYYGAHTGRFAGRNVQPHNFRRDPPGKKFYEKHKITFQKLIKMITGGKYGTPFDTLSIIGRILRNVIIPREGKVFLCGDLSAIEARGIFYLSGCKLGLDLYRKNVDVYVYFAKRLGIYKMLGHDLARQIGKIAVLGLGYGMWADTFSRELAKVIKRIDKNLAKKIVGVYRNTFKEVTQFWRDIETAYTNAVKYPGRVFTVGVLKIWKSGENLIVKFPSGSTLYYYRPGISEGKFYYISPRGGRHFLWSGSMAENVTQRFARDILAHMMLEIDNVPGIDLALTVHDENLAECSVKDKAKKLKVFHSIMNTAPDWCKDMPIASETGIMERYGKL